MKAITQLKDKVLSAILIGTHAITLTFENGKRMVIEGGEGTRIYGQKLSNVMGAEVPYERLKGATIVQSHLVQTGKPNGAFGAKASLAIDFGAIDLMVHWENVNPEATEIVLEYNTTE